VRAALRESGYKRLYILEEIADNPDAASRDRIVAIGVMLEHGMRGNITIDDVRYAVSRTLELIEEVAPRELAEELVRRIRPIWTTGG
jgi:hypothetical protein